MGIERIAEFTVYLRMLQYLQCIVDCVLMSIYTQITYGMTWSTSMWDDLAIKYVGWLGQQVCEMT